VTSGDDRAGDGLERLRRWRDEDRGVPPAFGRLGARLADVGAATTAVHLPLTTELLLPDGRSSGAVTSLLADFALTTSVIASLPDLRGVTTVALTVEHLALPPTTGALVSRCTATPYADGRPSHAVGALHDDAGRQVAAVSGWFLAAPAEAASAERVGLVREPAAAHLLDLLGVTGGPRFDLAARDALSNALGTMHGGIGALAAQLAAETALATELRPLTSTFAFLRPTPRDGTVTVDGAVVRAGRRTGAATATVTGPDGRAVLTSTLVVG
jgi:acyl-coenzyme A thioesterase PaaI-like protein